MPEIWRTLKDWPELILERLADAGVARIVLNRPDKRNCWNRALCLAFLEALEIVRADKELKVVITKGAGTIYSSGLDLAFLREVSNGPLLDWDRPNLTIQIAEALRAFPRILIAQVHGYCLGGALGIMNCHDIVFAAEDEKDLHAKLDEALEQCEVGDLLIGHQQHRPIDEFQRGLGLRIVERIRGEAVQHARRVAEERFGVDELDERFADDGLLIGKPPVANDAVDRPIELGRDVGADFRHFTVLNTLNFMSSWNVMVESRSSRDSRSA